MLVKVTLEDGNHFLTSVSPKSLPLIPTGFGYSRAPPRDLEIDTKFAGLLGISSSYGTEVYFEKICGNQWALTVALCASLCVTEVYTVEPCIYELQGTKGICMGISYNARGFQSEAGISI